MGGCACLQALIDGFSSIEVTINSTSITGQQYVSTLSWTNAPASSGTPQPAANHPAAVKK